MSIRLQSGFVAIALLFPLVRGYARVEASARSLCTSSTAIGVVRAYYRALDEHRAAAAKACLTAQYLARLSTVVDPDWKNVTAARVVRIRARAVTADILPPDIKPAPYRAVQVAADVVMHYRRIGGSPNGLNIWFIYVIKQHSAFPWQIADIGSGP